MIPAITPFIPALFNGLLLTLFYFLLGAIGSMAFGLPVALGLGSPSLTIRLPTVAYVEFFRNTPLLVQLFWIQFALPIITGVNTTAQQTAAIAIVVVMTAYMSEIYRAGFNSVAPGQNEAGLALGLRPVQRWWLIIIPQAFRTVLPAVGNTLVSLLKATAILSVLSVPELMRTTGRISDYTANPMLFYSVASLIYIGLGLLLSHSLRRLERRLDRARKV
ncbi:amino acid ABC transporter permease [Mesorhizobium sp. NZP2298]|uniref:amino acid ABC transporter permease n=1 Tax=Mesorhizobium sp. NZP2298 TaxID=2483403 RepID=UPI0015573FF0|nr:amino acid ABC transporter permease [Mesorhizobium sp. NZP2298]QKC98328.1 amino acid ABC transporter permease [Mesorhizobium sp. NZP2298]